MTNPETPGQWSAPGTPSPYQTSAPPYAAPPTTYTPAPTYQAVPGYGQQPYYTVPQSRGTNGLAIAGLVLSLVGFAPVGAILGHVARSQIKRTGEDGDGIALAAIIIGWVLTGLSLLACIGYAVAVGLFVAAAGTTGTTGG